MSATASVMRALSELAVLRDTAEKLRAEKKARHDAFLAANVDLFAALAEVEKAIATQDGIVRAVTLALHEAEPDATVDGVQVVTSVQWSYSQDAALAWVKEHATHLLVESFDMKAVKKIAEAGLLPFATKVETPAARIASDLTEYLAIPEAAHG
jgi:hypothetical protein